MVDIVREMTAKKSGNFLEVWQNGSFDFEHLLFLFVCSWLFVIFVAFKRQTFHTTVFLIHTVKC